MLINTVAEPVMRLTEKGKRGHGDKGRMTSVMIWNVGAQMRKNER